MMNDLQRHEESGAVLSTDSQTLNKYKAERKFRQTVSNLERDFKEIRETLASMCERITKLENK